MPLECVSQPDVIDISPELRLRHCRPEEYAVAVPWYRDWDVYHFSEGKNRGDKLPDENYVKGMYEYLDSHGELYFIEVYENGGFKPVGDITLKASNPCIAIGDAKYREKGIGRAAMAAVLKRAKEIGIGKITDVTVYEDNVRSRRMLESLGFKFVRRENGEEFYELELQT